MRRINKGSQIVPININRAETAYNAIYIADLCLTAKTGYWEEPVAVFWQETPPKPEYSNYFGLYMNVGKLYICSAHSVAEGIWYGSEADDGEIIFSRFRHDYRVSSDKTTFVDGGRDYFRSNREKVSLAVVGLDFEVVNE